MTGGSPKALMGNVRPEPHGCWTWTGPVHAISGYGRVTVAGRRMRVHRFFYECLVGPIAPGLQIDHVCHNVDDACEGGPTCLHRRCVNPDHLDAVPALENKRRGKGPAARHRRVTHCQEGHELAGENLMVIDRSASGRVSERRCRRCDRARKRRAYATRREIAA